MFTVKIDDREVRALDRSLRKLGGSMGTVMSRALNKTATTARAKISRELSKRIGIPVGRIKANVIQHKAHRSKWRAAITLSGKRYALTDMKARQLKAGVSYRKAGTTGRTLIKSSFLATMPGGHIGAFKRKGLGRLPIAELRGPSLAGLYGGAEDLSARIFRESQQKLSENIASQIQLILNRRATV